MPLEIMEEKTDDQYLLEGIDINDKAKQEEIKRKKILMQKNAQVMEGNASKNIKEIHGNLEGINYQIDKA